MWARIWTAYQKEYGEAGQKLIDDLALGEKSCAFELKVANSTIELKVPNGGGWTLQAHSAKPWPLAAIMKYLLVIYFFLTSVYCFSQTNRIDSLINKLDNNQLRGTCHYAWIVEFNSDPGWELIKLGKCATDQLVKSLSDSSRGIAVHYVLTQIYKPDSSWVQTIAFANRDALSIYLCNGLYFFESPHGTYTDYSNLLTNVIRWKSYIKNNDN